MVWVAPGGRGSSQDRAGFPWSIVVGTIGLPSFFEVLAGMEQGCTARLLEP